MHNWDARKGKKKQKKIFETNLCQDRSWKFKVQ